MFSKIFLKMELILFHHFTLCDNYFFYFFLFFAVECPNYLDFHIFSTLSPISEILSQVIIFIYWNSLYETDKFG